MIFRISAQIITVTLAAAFLLPACVSQNEFERMKEEITATKGDVEKIRNLATVLATDQKKIEADLESLKEEISQLRAAAAAAAQPEKAQNKATGAKPKKKKKKK